MLLDIKQLREMDAKSLKGKAVELKKELFSLRFQKVAGQLKNTQEVRRVRRSIAQVKTTLTLLRA
jgi:large subunit ribosomal protein L29